MKPIRSWRLNFALVAASLLTTPVLTACGSGFVPGAIAVALEPIGATPDIAATRAVATIEAALSAPAPTAIRSSATVAPTWTPTLTQTPTPKPTSTPMPTSTPTPSSTPTPTPTPTPNQPATATALRRQIDIAVAAALTAQPTATPQPGSTPAGASTMLADAPPPSSSMQRIGIVGEDGPVNLRSGPSTDYPVLTGVNSGEEVLILGRNQDASWLHVTTANGTLGWMSADYVGTAQAPQSYPIVVETPMQAAPAAPQPGMP